MPIPRRIQLKDFACRRVSLPDSQESWLRLNPGHNDSGPVLLLGLGPRLPIVKPCAPIYCLEDESTRQQWPVGFADDNLCFTDEKKALDLSSSCRIFFYRPALRLAPDFWADFLARLQLRSTPAFAKSDEHARIWLPGNDRQLLHQELKAAFGSVGLRTIEEKSPLAPNAAELHKLFSGRLPAMLLSVNFRGLDPDGHIFYLCKALGIPVAIWLVDNPWHLLSGIRLPWWRKANIFVTDASFVTDLKANGANHVLACPLAAAPHMWHDALSGNDKLGAIFVGRSSFPGRDSFFGKSMPATAILQEATEILKADALRQNLPDYHWWRRRCPGTIWPGVAGRLAGKGADICSSLNRARWLKANDDIRIVGDNGWLDFLPEARILPPVDYYGSLARLYEGFVLNVTSLLLPHSLNQRHFDVWAAGGVLLSDATPGLEIFPAQLTNHVILASPKDFSARKAWLDSHLTFTKEMAQAWRELIWQKHRYEHRLAQICQTVAPALLETALGRFVIQ